MKIRLRSYENRQIMLNFEVRKSQINKNKASSYRKKLQIQ